MEAQDMTQSGSIVLKRGGHNSREEGVCLLEACAYIAGEPHSDHPTCVDPVLAAFGRAINDSMTDDERVLLVPLMTKLVGTATTDHKISLRRSMLIVDGLTRQILPEIFDSIGLGEQAETLRQLEQITDEKTASAAYSAAYSAASAADSAAYSAADSAARSAASAAYSAASAAYSAARSAAYSAAYSAADSAASAASAADSAAYSARLKIWTQVVELFSAAIEIK